MKALLIVDLQNDFLTGGALGVAGGDQVIPIINALIPCFSIIAVSQDWHPLNHVSFAASHPYKKVGDVVQTEFGEQILWPVHCVANTEGAALSPLLHKEKISRCFFKGTEEKIDSYSAFFDNQRHSSTGLDNFLEMNNVDELYIAGLTSEYCVLYSSLDALELGFKVSVITDACRPILLHPHDEELAWAAVTAAGGKLVRSQEILSDPFFSISH